MTTLDNNFYKALGMIEPGSVELLMKTEPDVDKVLAALPEIDQKVVAGLKKYDQFDPALIYAIKAIVDKQKETRNFCAGWSATKKRQGRENCGQDTPAQTVASTASTVDTAACASTASTRTSPSRRPSTRGFSKILSFNAGNHRLSEAGASGGRYRRHERLRRTRRWSHVPFRNSKLTYLLTDALARQGPRAHERAGAGVRREVAPCAREEGQAGQGAPRCQVQGPGTPRRGDGARRPPRLPPPFHGAVRAVIPHLLKSQS